MRGAPIVLAATTTVALYACGSDVTTDDGAGGTGEGTGSGTDTGTSTGASTGTFTGTFTGGGTDTMTATGTNTGYYTGWECDTLPGPTTAADLPYLCAEMAACRPPCFGEYEEDCASTKPGCEDELAALLNCEMQYKGMGIGRCRDGIKCDIQEDGYYYFCLNR